MSSLRSVGLPLRRICPDLNPVGEADDVVMVG
uniref:Uncharacterized protein n=1 Tax=Anguilla anguilla TaxID=7936 RepID=A0A0E9UH24_ANGAN